MVFGKFLHLSWFTKGLLGSMSLLQIEHLSEPEIAFNPPQLPFIFFPINITPSDIMTMITRSKIKVIKNISICIFYSKTITFSIFISGFEI